MVIEISYYDNWQLGKWKLVAPLKKKITLWLEQWEVLVKTIRREDYHRLYFFHPFNQLALPHY